MKTPRKILFEHHRQAEPRLNEIRRKVLAGLPALARTGMNETARVERSLSSAGLRKIWRELIWPSRRAWVGLSAVWLVIGAADLELKASSPWRLAERSAPAQVVVQAVEEQRRLLAELLPSTQRPPAEPPPPEAPLPSPRPRSEGRATFKSC